MNDSWESEKWREYEEAKKNISENLTDIEYKKLIDEIVEELGL